VFKRLRKRYEIGVLRLQPGDIVVLRTETDLDHEECLAIKAQFAANTGVTPVVLSGLDLSVIRAPEVPPFFGSGTVEAPAGQVAPNIAPTA
jgi:hypothetical protein